MSRRAATAVRTRWRGYQMSIRQYQDADADAVMALHQAALESTGALLPGPWDDDLRNIPEVFLNSGGEFLVAEHDGLPVGMGAIQKTDDTRAEIKRMRVHPNCQRTGVGARILKNLEARALELGFTVLHLETTALQTSAQAFYEKHGYHRTGTSRVLDLDVILFEKELCEESV